jgi:uncharacterized protein (DUF3084 family)
MNNQFKNKMVGCGATPKSNAGMFFCVHTNTILVALEDCSHKELAPEQSDRKVQTSKEDLMGIKSLTIHLNNKDLSIQRQDEIIKGLEEQIFDEEQELFEKDRKIAQLENELEEVCGKLFLEVNLR